MKEIAYLIEQSDLNLTGIEQDLAMNLVRPDFVKSNCHSSRTLLRALKQCLNLNHDRDDVDGEEVRKA